MDRPLRLAQVTQSLGIGGVETYLCRLTEALTARGHEIVMVLEEPGIYAERARGAGAELLVSSFDRRGCEWAASELRDRNLDLVHAHNYRAARFGAPLAGRLEVPYLMSVHGPRPWWKRAFFRAWSDPVVAMSEGDLENVSGLFGVDRDRVLLAFYGIDTERFRPGLEARGLRVEWGCPRSASLIVNVSRFSHRKARPALATLAALPDLRGDLDARLVLVGDGPELDRIEREIERANRHAGSVVARAAGTRTDIPRVMNAADAVIATANTALEAMACGVPTIAYGRTGYFGRVTTENFEEARAVCFGDHGALPRVNPVAHLLDDLRAVLRDRVGAREEAKAVREHVVERYGIASMADDMERIYGRVLGR